MKKLTLLVIIFIVPSAAHAAVLINEVAWMGSSASANAEWIELRNTGGDAVDLTGAKLIASSGSPSITLAGSITGNGYFLLERTSDDSVPGMPADQIYSGALTNSGTTLTLTDSGGAQLDQVVGGSNWVNIGGDNTSKQTAQRAGAGWVTADATPRALNASDSAGGGSSDPVDEATTTDSGTSTTSSGGSASIASSVVAPTGSLRISAGADRGIVALADARFTATVTKGGHSATADEVLWSFGDGSMLHGVEVLKHYRKAGIYIVQVEAIAGEQIAYDEIIITVKLGQVRVTDASAEGITITNDSVERLDLSRWQLRSAMVLYTIPEGTFILPKTSVFLAWDIVHLPLSYDVALLYPSGAVAAEYVPPVIESAATTTAEVAVQLFAPAISSYKVQAKAPVVSTAKPVAKSVTPSTHAKEAASAPAAANNLAAAGAALPVATSTPAEGSGLSGLVTSKWSYSFLGLLVLGGAALLIL